MELLGLQGVVSWMAMNPRVPLLSTQAPEGETQPMAEVDIFISTKRVKVLAADSQVPRGPGFGCRGLLGISEFPSPFIACPQDALMDHALQTISYIADIGPVLVVMARRRMARRTTPQDRSRHLYKMLCHVFHSEDVSSRALPPPRV